MFGEAPGNCKGFPCRAAFFNRISLKRGNICAHQIRREMPQICQRWCSSQSNLNLQKQETKQCQTHVKHVAFKKAIKVMRHR